nr:MAG TPA: hypothetical protein [Caudoviricetes sp.]
MLSSLLSEKSFSAYGDDLKGYIKELNGVSKSGKKASASIESFNEFLGKNGKQTVKTTTFMEDLESGIKSFGKTAGSALLNIGTDLLISGGIQAAAAGIDYVVNKQSNTIKAGSEVLSDYQNINQQMSESTSWVKTNAERYEELSKGVNNLGQNLSLTSADYEEYQQLSSQIAQQFPELVTGYDSLGKPIIGAAKSVSDLQTALKNAKFDAYNKNVKEAKDVTGKFYEEVMRSKTLPWQDAGSQKQLDGLEQFIKDYNKAFSTKGGNKPTGYIDLQKYMNMSTNAETGFNASDFGEAYQTLGLSQADIQDLIQELNSSNGKLKSGSDSAKTLATLMDGVGELQSDVNNSANELKQYIPSFLQANKKYQDLILDNDGLDSKVTSMINTMTMEDLESNGFTDKDNAADNIKKWASNVVNELDKSDIRDSIDSLFSFNENHAEDTAKDWYTTANAALDEADAKSESFNKKQLQEASGIYDEWLKVKDAMASITSRYDDTTREDAIRRFNTEDLEALGEIASADTDHKLSYDDAISQIENQKRQAELSVANLQKSVESITSQYSTISSAISDSMSDTGLSKDSIDAVKSSVQDVINSTDELKDFDLDGLFTNTSKGVKLNNSQLENLLDIQKDIKEQDFAESISQQTDELDKQAKQAEILKAKYGETSDEYVEALEKQKQAQEDLNATQQAQSQYYAQYQQQKQLFSDYAEWQRATQTENSGDKYLSMVSGLDTAKKAWDAGEIGTDDFKSFAKMISPSGATDPVNFAENYAKAARYLTSDESGLVHFFEDLSTKTDAAGQAMASFNEETQSWELNTHDLGEVAQKLGTGTPVVEALFGRAEDYGATTTVISDMQDGILKATEATKNWSEAKARLDQMNEENAQAQKEGKDPIYNATAIKAAEDEVTNYQQQIDGLQESMDYYAEHNLGSEAQQKKIKIAADEIKNIQEQVQAAENANNKALADSYRNMAKEKAAAAGITVDDNLNVTGDGKTAQQQLQEASKTSSVLSEDTFDYDKTNMSLDEIDSKINELQGKRADVEVAIQNGEESKQTLTALDTEVSSLEAQKVQVQIQTAVENGNSFQELLTLSDQELMTTVGCDASQVDQVRDEIQEMSGEQIDMTVAMNSDQFVALINAITGEKIEIPVEANTDGVEAETKSAVEGTDAKVTPSVDTSQVESETQSAVQNAAEGTKPSVEVTGNVTTLTAGTGLTPVAVTGNVVQLTGTPSQPVDVNANATTVTGTPSGTVDVNANATTISGEPSGTVDVKGNVTSVSGTPSGTVEVKGHITAGKVDNANGTTSSGTINYKKGEVEKADGTKSTGTIDYKKGNVEKADGTVSTGVINYDLGTVATPKSATATGVINYTLGTVAKPKASGTMSAPSSFPAHASGTVYNVINYGSAYANGKVGLQRSETALVNEIGQESIIRGDRWLMLPPGMHTQSLKKGDIVLNAQQTADLLAHGKANGTARAYAHGSLSDIAPAHANSPGVGAATLKFQGGLTSSKYGNTKSSDTSSGNNTNATKANTKATKENTKSTKKSTSVFDYVARKLTYFANKTKEIADKINDYVSSAFKTSQLKKQITAIGNEITVNSKGANTYLKKANSVKLNAKVKKDIREGKYAITDYNTESSSNGKKTQYEKIQEYAKYYDEYVKCTQAVQDLKNQQLELFEQWANMPTEAAEKKIEKLKAGFNGLTAIQARLKTASLGGSAQAYLNEEMKSSLVTATNNRNSAKAAVNNATNRLSSANRTYDTAKRNESHVIENADKSKKKAEKAGDKLLRNKSVSLTDSEKKKVVSGKTISTKGLSGKKKTAVKKYNTAVKKSNAAKKKASKAKSNTKKASNSISSARSAVTSARSAYQSANDLYQSYATQYDTASKYLNSGDTLGYQNYLTDLEFQNTKEQNKANQEAYAQAKKNTQNTQARQTSAKSAVDKASSANAKAKSTGKSLVSKYKGKLKQSQINALNSGKKVSTKGTSGALKKKLKAYNKALANAANALKQARAQYDQISTEVDIARNAEAQAAANAAESQAETAQAAIEAEKTKFENVSNYYDKRMDYEKALAEKAEKDRDRNEAHGDYTASRDYDKEISNEEKQRDLAQQKVDALKKQLADAMSSGVVKQGTEEWLEMSTTITEAENSVSDLNTTIENTKQKQLTTKYEEMFDRAIAKAEQLISKIDTINDLLTEEMMYDYDTGQLTDMGALSLTLNAKSMNDSLDNLQQYVNKRRQIIDDFANGDKDLSKYGEKTYDELMSENDSNIQNALKNANSYKQQILSIVKTQSQKEQDALFKVIDARKEALKKKRDYYEYDKKIKSSTKEINLLQQQIDALDGVTDAESRAQKARLEAQLKDAQDDLDDTVRDHVYDLQVDGLDDLEDQLKEDFEKWSNELSGNLDKMSKAINDAINNSGASAADAMNTLAEVLKQFNITPDQLGISASNLSAGNIKKYDKGTKHIGHNSVAMTNENGREIVVTNKGWLTKLGASDQIISTDNTAALIEMAEKYRNNDLISNIKLPEIKSDGGKSVTINYGGNTFTVQGDLVRDTLPELNKLLDMSSKKTQADICKNIRQFGW